MWVLAVLMVEILELAWQGSPDQVVGRGGCFKVETTKNNTENNQYMANYAGRCSHNGSKTHLKEGFNKGTKTRRDTREALAVFNVVRGFVGS